MSIAPERILFEDEHFLAVHKLSGELVVRGSGALGKLPLLDFLKKDFPGLRAVHRLDFETSGVVLFARTKAALDAVAPLRSSDSRVAAADKEKPDGRTSGIPMEKTYVALVKGRPRERQGIIKKPLPARAGGEMVPAETKYKILEEFETVSLIEAVITKGRHHQIRRHFQSIGNPLILDDVYGDPKANKAFSKAFQYRKFFLHAENLTFKHPFTGAETAIKAPLPPAFEAVLKKLRST